MHVTARRSQVDKKSRRAGIAAVKCRRDLKRRECVRYFYAEARAHLRRNTIQKSNRLDEQWIRAWRVIIHQDEGTTIMLSNGFQDVGEVCRIGLNNDAGGLRN